MELEKFRVRGLRSLADIDWVPVLRPTILTGVNDGGKTTVLLALEFLLTGRRLAGTDLTNSSADDCMIEGVFRTSDAERDDLGLPDPVHIRRVHSRDSGTVVLHVLAQTQEDERLRDLDGKTLEQLKAVAAELGVAPNGHAGRKVSYLGPLRSLAERQPQVDDWRPVARATEAQLPRLISFASTSEPNPESDIRQALGQAYAQAIEDDSVVGPVRAAERKVQDLLAREASALRDHIVKRCPELQELSIEPSVSFQDGFRGVALTSAREEAGAPVPFNASGAGTRRRINLATWEWTRLLLEKEEQDARSIIVAYDEPDTHLDYRHQRELVDLVRAQCEQPRVSVLLATHSLNLIDRIPIENVVHLELDGGTTRVSRLLASGHADLDQHLQAIATSMGLSNSVLLHERCFLGVEGVTEQRAIPLLFRTATGMSLQSAGIALVHAGGNAGARELCRFLNDHGRLVRFIIDRDSTGQSVFRPEALQRAGIKRTQMFLVGKAEIEDLFSDDQWAGVANQSWHRRDEAMWDPQDFAALRGAGKFSDKLQSLITGASDNAPSSKAALLPALAEGLTNPHEVPAELRAIFDQLLGLTRTA